MLSVCKVGGLKLASDDDVIVDTYGGTVTVHSVKKSDQGRYACTAINRVGSDTGYIQLRVLGTIIISVVMIITIIIVIVFIHHTTVQTQHKK